MSKFSDAGAVGRLRAVVLLRTRPRLAGAVILGAVLLAVGDEKAPAAGPATVSVQGKWAGTGLSMSSMEAQETFSIKLRLQQRGSEVTGSGFLCESAPCEPTGSIVVLVGGFFLDQTVNRNFIVVDFHIQGTDGACGQEFFTGTGRLGPTQDRLTLNVSGRDAECREKSLTMTLERQPEGR